MKKTALVLFAFIFALSINQTWAQDETNSKDVKVHDVKSSTNEKKVDVTKSINENKIDVTNPQNITTHVDSKTMPTAKTALVTKGTGTPVNKVCLVSGEDIDSKITADYKGKTYAFCCKTCLKKFTKDPEKYILKYDKQTSKTKN